jgi:phage gp16-like protein
MITNRQKAMIHVARAKVGMSEDDYRAMLSGFGVESSKQLTQGKFDAVMQHFGKLGFASLQARYKVKSSRDMLRSKVKAILADLGLTDSYADSISKSRFGVDTWGWLKADELHKLVAMLTYHQKRQRAKRCSM